MAMERMSRDRYSAQKKATSQKAATDAAKKAAAPEPAPKPSSASSCKENVRAENGGVWISSESAEKLRLAMLQIAEIFGECKQEEPAPETEPEPVAEPEEEEETPKKTPPKPEVNRDAAQKADASADPVIVATGPQFELHRDYDFAWQYIDAVTGKIAYADDDDIFTALTYAADRNKILRMPVWLKDKKVIRPMTSSEAKRFFPFLFL